jgi:ATP-dependent DNA helicase RecG
VDLIENEEYGNCCLVKATKQVLDKLDLENRTLTRITPKERQETRLLDPVALREAVINAIIHNDDSYEGVPKFELFADRLEITSTGSVPQGLSEAEFFEGYSIPRNKELMRIFRDLDMVEYLGSGMPRILRTYPKECFRFTENFTRMIFPFSQTGTSEKTSEKILRLIRKDNHLTIAVLSENIGVSTRSIERALKNLQEQGMLVRQGPDKGGHWQILLEKPHP